MLHFSTAQFSYFDRTFHAAAATLGVVVADAPDAITLTDARSGNSLEFVNDGPSTTFDWDAPLDENGMQPTRISNLIYKSVERNFVIMLAA